MGRGHVRRALLAMILLGAPAFADHELVGRDITEGQTLYQDHCATCHGTNLEGQPNWRSAGDDGKLPAPPHDETGHTWHHDNQLLLEYTKLGRRGALAARGMDDFNSGMPAFEGVITDREIWDILAYIRSTWPTRVQEMQASRNPPH